MLLNNRGRSWENGEIGQVGDVNSGSCRSAVVLFPRCPSIELSQEKLRFGRYLGLRNGISKNVSIGQR